MTVQSSDLIKLFDSYLPRANKAVTWVEAGQRWYVSTCVICCINTGESDTPVTRYKDKDIFTSIAADKSIVYPENYITEEYKGLAYSKFDKFFVGPDSIISVTKDASLKIGKGHLKRVHYMLNNEVCDLWSRCKDEDCSVAFSKDNLPMLKLNVGNDYIYIAFVYDTKPADITLILEGKKYKPYNWDEKFREYKTLEEEKMTKLNLPDLNAIKDIESAIGGGLKDLGINPDMSEKDKRALEESAKKAEGTKSADVVAETAAKIKEMAKQVSEVYKPVEEVKEEVKEEDNASDSIQSDSSSDTTEKKVRKRSPNKPKLIALPDIIEQLNSPIPDNMKDADILLEIRQLRDLSLVVSRRMSNLATGRIADIQEDMKILEQMKALIK